jgi:hypothetical protein
MDNRECYIDKFAKDSKKEPLKRWLTKEGYKNLMEVDKNRLIKQEQIKVNVPKEFTNVTENQSNKPQNGPRVGNVEKRGRKAKAIHKDTNNGNDQSA